MPPAFDPPSEEIQRTREYLGLSRLPDPALETTVDPRYGFATTAAEKAHLAEQQTIAAAVFPATGELGEAYKEAFAGAYMDLAGHKVVVLETAPGQLPRDVVRAMFPRGAEVVFRLVTYSMNELSDAFARVMQYGQRSNAHGGLNAVAVDLQSNRVAVTVRENAAADVERKILSLHPAVVITGRKPLPTVGRRH